jgi:queuosine precursor transporter
MFEQIVGFLQNLPSEMLLCLEYLTCFVAILGATRYAGAAGLFTYISIAVFIANIQVLKTASFSFLDFPVALGTVVFSSTFLASDILTEFYGPSIARKAVWVGFGSNLLATLLMLITISINPADTGDPMHQALTIIFMPIPALFIASLISYLICQQIDIWIFQLVKNLTGGKYLWLRTSLSSAISALLDNVVFSLLAWVVLAAHPVSTHELIYTYILGTYIFRIIVTLLQMPIIYLIRRDSYV